MTGAFKVDSEQLLDAVDRLRRFELRLQDAMQHADQEVRRLHVEWTGSAAEAHEGAHQEWLRGCRDMHESLVVMRQVASIAHDNYVGAAQTNVAMWAM